MPRTRTRSLRLRAGRLWQPGPFKFFVLVTSHGVSAARATRASRRGAASRLVTATVVASSRWHWPGRCSPSGGPAASCWRSMIASVATGLLRLKFLLLGPVLWPVMAGPGLWLGGLGTWSRSRRRIAGVTEAFKVVSLSAGPQPATMTGSRSILLLPLRPHQPPSLQVGSRPVTQARPGGALKTKCQNHRDG